MKLIDTHAHIYYDDYSDNIHDIIQRATDIGVNKIISVGVDLSTSEACINLAEKFSNVYATCGYHPHESIKTQKKYLYELENFYQHPKVVAIGEIGLDYHYNFSEPIIQKKIYNEQLEMAKSINAPVVIHCRKSEEDILKGIDETGNSSGVIHCFSSDINFANAIPHRGKTNEPANVKIIAEKIASIKDICVQEVADSTYKTAHKLFTKLNN